MQVYTALVRLEKRALITVIRKTKVQSFQVSDPGVLFDHANELRTLAREVTDEVRHRLSHREEAVSVRTLVGPEAFLANLEETVRAAGKDPEKILRILGGAGETGNDPFAITSASYPKYVRLSQELGIKKRVLVDKDRSKVFIEKFLPHPHNRLRVASGLFSTPTFTRITRDLVTMEFCQPEPTVIQIRNKTIAKAHREQFDFLWEQGKEIKK